MDLTKEALDKAEIIASKVTVLINENHNLKQEIQRLSKREKEARELLIALLEDERVFPQSCLVDHINGWLEK